MPAFFKASNPFCSRRQCFCALFRFRNILTTTWWPPQVPEQTSLFAGSTRKTLVQITSMQRWPCFAFIRKGVRIFLPAAGSKEEIVILSFLNLVNAFLRVDEIFHPPVYMVIKTRYPVAFVFWVKRLYGLVKVV